MDLAGGAVGYCCCVEVGIRFIRVIWVAKDINPWYNI